MTQVKYQLSKLHVAHVRDGEENFDDPKVYLSLSIIHPEGMNYQLQDVMSDAPPSPAVPKVFPPSNVFAMKYSLEYVSEKDSTMKGFAFV
jgi:hypothetical protein